MPKRCSPYGNEGQLVQKPCLVGGLFSDSVDEVYVNIRKLFTMRPALKLYWMSVRNKRDGLLNEC